ncbi:MAG: cation-transporting P-type ATPase, partial [Bacteroidia bacterium]|nr:cation-transporting P-type ATPase [Bacteroidia bacterium]
MDQNPPFFWSISAKDLLTRLQVKDSGLTTIEAKKRLTSYGANRLKPKKRSDAFTLLISQFKSPII